MICMIEVNKSKHTHRNWIDWKKLSKWTTSTSNFSSGTDWVRHPTKLILWFKKNCFAFHKLYQNKSLDDFEPVNNKSSNEIELFFLFSLITLSIGWLNKEWRRWIKIWLENTHKNTNFNHFIYTIDKYNHNSTHRPLIHIDVKRINDYKK